MKLEIAAEEEEEEEEDQVELEEAAEAIPTLRAEVMVLSIGAK